MAFICPNQSIYYKIPKFIAVFYNKFIDKKSSWLDCNMLPVQGDQNGAF